MNIFRRVIVLSLALLLILPSTASASPGALLPALTKIDASLRLRLQTQTGDDPARVVVRLRGRPELSFSPSTKRPERQRLLVQALKTQNAASHTALKARLDRYQADGKVRDVAQLWIINGLSMTASADAITEMAALPEVESITSDWVDIVPAASTAYLAPEDNLALINAPALWELGYSGQGVVVASLDTGVSLGHPELASRWRGGSNSWYDPYGQHTDPADPSGHGTQVMGVMVAGDASGGSIGVAPQAQWISAKIFNDQGQATATAVHQAFQWLLDPDGNPATADAPQVVNNSWAYGGPGCNLEFQADLQALRLAGILPVFSAGNYGPNSGTSPSPANYPEAFAVGAVNNQDGIYAASSRGPSACGEPPTIFPELVAPGVNITTTDLFGMYFDVSGTSVSAPHVSGALALLLSAFPNLTAEQQAAALTQTAVDLGLAGPDDTFGYGRLDVMAAYEWIESGSNPPPPPPLVAIFSDGFESGDLSAWTGAVTDSGRLTVEPQAALAGAFGLRAEIIGTGPIYVRDDTPNAETAYQARFNFSPNGVGMANGRLHDLFRAADASGKPVIRLQMRFYQGNYQLRATSRNETGGETATGWYTLSDAVHSIEVGWQASTGGDANAVISLWVDDVLLQTRTGFSTGAWRVEQALLGPQGIARSISGIEYYDSFVSTRGTFIGP